MSHVPYPKHLPAIAYPDAEYPANTIVDFNYRHSFPLAPASFLLEVVKAFCGISFIRPTFESYLRLRALCPLLSQTIFPIEPGDECRNAQIGYAKMQVMVFERAPTSVGKVRTEGGLQRNIVYPLPRRTT
ncbi:MAG TPA: hypothetical protein VJ750_12580 [Rhizomicrobium sp.]|nr:hypothetical protein [Rhizomicrobium sp.]